MYKLILLFICLSLSASEKPNFIIIFTDDQGYNDIGCFGSKDIKTPHLDKMAAEGLMLSDFYSASSVCSPSRAALLTGRYPKRTTVTRVLFPRSQNGLPQEEVTIAEVLKKADYRTACVGKWHLGHLAEFLPTSQGFDSYFGIPYSNDMSIAAELKISENVKFTAGFTAGKMAEDRSLYKKQYGKVRNRVPLMRNEEIIEYPAEQSTLSQRYTDEAIKIVEEKSKQPFFIYLAHTMPHIPLYSSERFKGKSAGGPYGDTIEEIDWNVGRLLKALKDSGKDKNTIVIYTTDNGPWKLSGKRGGSAFPLSGHKFSTLEGGQRVPTIIRAPGLIEAGRKSASLCTTMDLLPTFAALAGAELPSKTIDGRDISALLKNGNHPKEERPFYFYAANSPKPEGIRLGKWKYLHISGKRNYNRQGPQLYNLEEDIAEEKNLISKYPEIAARLKKQLLEFDAKM